MIRGGPEIVFHGEPGLPEEHLVPLTQVAVRRLVHGGQELLNEAKSFVLGTVALGNPWRVSRDLQAATEFRCDNTPVAATVMHSSYDTQFGTERDGISLLWWLRMDSPYQANMAAAGRDVSATFVRSHVEDPYDGVSVNMNLFVRPITADDELPNLLVIFNTLRASRPADRLRVTQFAGRSATRELFVGTPLGVEMPLMRTVKATGDQLPSYVHLPLDVFKGRKAEDVNVGPRQDRGGFLNRIRHRA